MRSAVENRILWLLAAGFTLVAAVSLPGHLSYDSIMQLNEGRRGFYANWHPPMMSWLLGIFDDIVPGTALFVLFDLALLFGSLTALTRLHARPSREAAAVLALCILTPQFLLYQGIVWKDILFADLAVAGFAALAFAAVNWAGTRARWGGLVLALLLLSVATLVRQNGGVVLPAAAFGVGWLALRNAPGRPILAGARHGVGALALSAFVVVGMHSALALRIPGDPSPTLQFRLLQFYDLIGAAKAEPGITLPFLDDDDPELETLMRSDGVRLYTPERNDTLAQSERLQKAYFESPDETIPEEWHGLIDHHPGLYLRIRAEVFRWVFMTPNLAACRPVFSGVSGPAQQMAKLGLTPRFDQRDAVLGWYTARFSGTPLLSHLFFALLALVFAVVLVLRKRPADIVMASMLLSALAFTASFFVISIACDYRYLYFLDLSVLVSGFHLALDWRSAWSVVPKLISGSPTDRSAHDR
jgi:hypothetical protein